MIDVSVTCFKCWRSQWRATGRLIPNRRGLLRAELVCEACHYTFHSARPAALAAARAASELSNEISTKFPQTVENVEPTPSEPQNPDFRMRQVGPE